MAQSDGAFGLQPHRGPAPALRHAFLAEHGPLLTRDRDATFVGAEAGSLTGLG
jgi:hypothetical protein